MKANELDPRRRNRGRVARDRYSITPAVSIPSLGSLLAQLRALFSR